MRSEHGDVTQGFSKEAILTCESNEWEREEAPCVISGHSYPTSVQITAPKGHPIMRQSHTSLTWEAIHYASCLKFQDRYMYKHTHTQENEHHIHGNSSEFNIHTSHSNVGRLGKSLQYGNTFGSALNGSYAIHYMYVHRGKSNVCFPSILTAKERVNYEGIVFTVLCYEMYAYEWHWYTFKKQSYCKDNPLEQLSFSNSAIALQKFWHFWHFKCQRNRQESIASVVGHRHLAKWFYIIIPFLVCCTWESNTPLTFERPD